MSVPLPSSGQLTLSNGELELALSVPGAPGTYGGTRFSWAGIIAWAQFQGHRLFGPWRGGAYPVDEHDNVTGTAGEFGMGNAGMTPPPGFEEAATGGHFVKIGVGILRRPDEAPYSFSRRYEIVEVPPWQVQWNKAWVEMRQRVTHDGYGYDYRHRIELVPGQTAFITRHTLLNTGRQAIHQAHYSHNFLAIDQQPVGPAYEVTFPFVPASGFDAESAAYFEGRALKFREPLQPGMAAFTYLSGFGDTASDNQVTVRHREAGVEVRISGDCPVERYHFFAVTGAVCPEPFVGVHVAPGETAAWSHRYDLSCQAPLAPKEIRHAN